MNYRIVGLIFLAILGASVALPLITTTAPAPSWPILPSSTVQLNVIYWRHSYFKSTLSGVPDGYDVSNGVYKGWCVDRSTKMVRGVDHDVILYSSLTPPTSLTGLNWVAINYIINHPQGTQSDVQVAIWHYTDSYAPLTPTAQAMVDEADANPEYDVLTAPILAVIAMPSDRNGVQITIIEISRPGPSGLSPGYWKHNVKVYNGGPGSYSSPETGLPHETDESMLGYAATILVNHAGELPAGVNTGPEFLQWANSIFQDPANNNMWLTIANWFNQASGRSLYSDS